MNWLAIAGEALATFNDTAASAKRIADGLDRRNELLEESNKLQRAGYEANLAIIAAAERLEKKDAEAEAERAGK